MHAFKRPTPPSLLGLLAAVSVIAHSGLASADPPIAAPPALPPTPMQNEAQQSSTSPAYRIKIETNSRQGTRTAGWFVLGTSLAVASGLVIGTTSSSRVCMSTMDMPNESTSGSSARDCQREYHIDAPYAIIALAVAGIGGTAGLVLLTQDDERKITISPLATGAAANSTSALVPSGLMLRGEF